MEANVKIFCSDEPGDEGVGTYINMPSGLTIDSSKIAGDVAATTEGAVVGYGSYWDNSNSDMHDLVVQVQATTQLGLFYKRADFSQVRFEQISNVSPITFDNNDFLYFYFSVPVTEWA
jgi:hypothetical protein